jgi:peptidoglycan/xylan/chitin deacetylase (PgdA/CDA1 family)
MKIPGLKTLGKTVRWIKSRFVRRGIILGYHRVAETSRDPYQLCISPDSFESQLRLISEAAHPLRLQELLTGLQEEEVPKNAVVITFDDGYADVLYNALPLLEKYNIPATIFITTGRLGQEFWWDELERIIFTSEKMPGKMPLSINIHYSGMKIDSLDSWESSHSKYHLLKAIHRWMQILPDEERDDALGQLRDWFGMKQNFSERNRALTSDELVSLSQHDLIEVGSHSVSHMSLPSLSTEMQKQEVLQSKIVLERLLGTQVKSFSYPSGMKSEGLSAVLCSAGYNCACTSVNDIVWHGSDPFELPRFWLQHLTHGQFTGWLRNWLLAI